MQKGGKVSRFLRQIFVAAVFIGAFIFAGNARAASLYLSPSAATYRVGETFQVSMFVSSADQAMNACESAISFSTDKLEVISVSTKNSIFSLMVENPTFSNANGVVNFSGIVLNPGYTGKSGRLVTINFKAKALGKATVSIGSAQVLANDGQGTNILSSRGSGTYTIVEKAVTPPAEPKPTPAPSPATTPAPAPATTTAEIPIASCVTTTVNIITSTVCRADQLPDVFLKIGNITFDSASLALLFLILMILVSAVISFWGFFEAYIHEHHGKKRKK
jgi:hypothetical protein